MKTQTLTKTARRIFLAAAVATTATITANARDKLYWTGATSSDYNLPANWNSNNVDVVSGVAPTQWRVTWDQVYDDDHAQRYQIDVAGRYSASGNWTFNGGTALTPFEIHCDNAANGISPNYTAFTRLYNYASSLTLGDSAETWVWFNGGRYEAFRDASTIGSADYAGHLILGNDSVATVMVFSNNVYLAQGSLVSTNANLMTEKEMRFGSSAGLTALVDKTGGDWVCKSTFYIAKEPNATASFYHRGGTLTTGTWIGVGSGNGASTRSYFEISGGTVRNDSNDITVGDYGQIGASSEILVKGDGKMISARNVIVGARAAGVLTIEGNGLVTAPNCTKICNDATCEAGEDCAINLNGGVLETKYVQYGAGAANGTIAFNGGTLKAYADNQTLIYSNNKLSVTATALGGAIDTAGYSVTIAEDIADATGETGTMTFKGGGKATLNVAPAYSGVTTVEVGTTLVVPAAIAGDKLAFNVPGELADGVYTVVSISGDSQFADDVLSGKAEGFVLSGDKKKICYVQGMDTTMPIYIGTDGNLSAAENWLDGTVPTGGTGDAQIFCASSAALTVGDTFAPATITIPSSSAVVTIGAGNLQLNTLTNATRLAIASGASLTVEGDIVLTESGTVLYSNEGAVLVKGDVDFQSKGGGNKTYYQYEVVTDATTPIMAGGLAYNGPNDYLTVYLGKNIDSSRAGQWVIGANGLHYKSCRNIWHTGFMMGQGMTTLYSSSDWTLASSGRGNSTRDLGNYYNAGSTVIQNSSLVLDTNNYTNNAVSHTITLNGRLISSATEDPAVTIKGAGTVVVNTSEGVGREGYRKTSIGTTLAVTDTATLKINAGKSIIGDGKISLATGTTLALESTANTFTTPDILPVALPETGTAAINIDGERLKGGVDFAICTLADLPDGYNVANHVTVTGTALTGRKYTVKTVEVTGNETTVTKLVLNITPSGLILIFR